MAEDKRELILARLHAILGGMAEFTAARAFRNRGELEAGDKPGAVLLDGSEQSVLSTMGKSRDGQVPATIFQLRPQIFVVLKPRDNVDNLKLDNQAAPIGPELSSYRNKIIRAILRDGALRGLLGSNGDIEYTGSTTDMLTGSSMEGMFQLDFAINYVLDPSQL